MAKRKSPQKTKSLFLIKPLLICFLSGLVIVGVFFLVQNMFLESRFFDVQKIAVITDEGSVVPRIEGKLKPSYIGRNIFTIDLGGVQRSLKKQFPEMESIEVRRGLPDVLEIFVLSRDPIAVIDASGGVVIDKDGVVLSVGIIPKNLAVIKGVKLSVKKSSIGENITNRALERALVLLKMIRKKMGDKALHMESLDASDNNNILLKIDGVEIKMGSDNFLKKIDQLLEVLNDPKMNLKDIRYIDLRFNDIVIAPK